MKSALIICSFVLILLFSCSTNDNSEYTLPYKVALAYGFDKLEDVETIQYTWNVQMDSVNVGIREWGWNLKKGEVSYSGPDTTVNYQIAEKSSGLEKVDGRFINDKYWLLFPFQLAWDTGYTHEVVMDQTSPIAGENTTKLIIRYNDVDGYTPGDAYDLYLDEDNMIKEWVFRRGDGPTGRAMTWENVQDFNGVKIALDHKNDEGNRIIWFTNVKVE